MHRFKSAILAIFHFFQRIEIFFEVPLNLSKAWNAKLEAASFFAV